MIDTTDLVSAREACVLVGITYRQLDYWERTALIALDHPASGSGSRRRVTAAEIRQLRFIRAITEVLGTNDRQGRANGGNLRIARTAWETLRREPWLFDEPFLLVGVDGTIGTHARHGICIPRAVWAHPEAPS